MFKNIYVLIKYEMILYNHLVHYVLLIRITNRDMTNIISCSMNKMFGDMIFYIILRSNILQY
jgi:hypothetical protein